MRKRIRKKKHLREFKEFGCALQIDFAPSTDFDAFLDDFIFNAIEKNNMKCMTSGTLNDFDSYIFLGKKDIYQENYDNHKHWLKSHPSVGDWKISGAVDAWHEA